MIRTLPHILARVFGTPLLVHPARLDGLLAGLSAALIQRGSLQADASRRPRWRVNGPGAATASTAASP